MIAIMTRRSSVEMTDSPGFAPRVRRLVWISATALGAIWAAAVTTLDAPLWVESLLAAGWALMPVLLALSLREPRVRYFVALPATLVTVALGATIVLGVAPTTLATAGWVLITAGILFGGLLGMWFWYRMIPVPAGLSDPYATGRWMLIGIHTGLILVGLLLAIAG